MNLFDPPDTSNGYISRQGVREDHSDPTRTINLAKWVVTAPYTDENEEISPPNKKIRTLTVNYDRNFRTTTSILRQTLFRHVKIIFPKYFCLNYPREKAIFQTGSLMLSPRCIAYAMLEPGIDLLVQLGWFEVFKTHTQTQGGLIKSKCTMLVWSCMVGGAPRVL